MPFKLFERHFFNQIFCHPTKIDNKIILAMIAD